MARSLSQDPGQYAGAALGLVGTLGTWSVCLSVPPSPRAGETRVSTGMCPFLARLLQKSDQKTSLNRDLFIFPSGERKKVHPGQARSCRGAGGPC